MPKNNDIQKVLCLGSGPVTIGQGPELEMATYQVCRFLKEEGYEVALMNNNPAALTTDPGIADRVYLMPLTMVNLQKVIYKEKPEALFIGYGGQNAQNLLRQISDEDWFSKTGIQLIDINQAVIIKTGDREAFRKLMEGADLPIPEGISAGNIKTGIEIGLDIGFPLIIRPYFTSDGLGSAIVYNQEELGISLDHAMELSPVKKVILEKSVDGWEEYELEVLRDNQGAIAVLSATEYLDPVGVHPGDSMAVIPPQSLKKEDFELLTVYSSKALEVVALMGSATLRFARNPETHRWIILGLNPGFNRNSAWVSLVTGISVAEASAKIALGYSLQEIIPDFPEKNQPLADGKYVTVRLPRFNFEKFPETESTLNTSMKSVGEVLAFGACFQEALQKGIRSLEIGRMGIGAGQSESEEDIPLANLKRKLANPNPERLYFLSAALKKGIPLTDVYKLSKFPDWLVKEIAEMNAFEKELTTYALYNLPAEIILKAKQRGYSDIQLAKMLRVKENDVREKRKQFGIIPKFGSLVTANHSLVRSKQHFFSTYGNLKDDNSVGEKQKILIVGSGPNRIGNENVLSYAAVHARKAVAGNGYQSIFVNCDPDGNYTDNNLADKLYFEPMNLEELLNIIEIEKPQGVILQFSGEKAIAIAEYLQKSAIPILGTAIDDIKNTRQPEKFESLLAKLKMNQMKLENPVVDAIAIAVDCVGDGNEAVVAGVMEQIEEAGINFGDSAVSLPPYSVADEVITCIKEAALRLARELAVKGFLHVRFAVRHDSIYVLEVIPGVGLSLPFVCKATGIDWFTIATQAILGVPLKSQDIPSHPLKHSAVKEAVFSFSRFPGVDTVLGPKMRSTGMVMGLDSGFGMAFLKSQLAAGENIPLSGTVYLSIRNEDKRAFITIARQLTDLGFKLIAPDETAAILLRNDIVCEIAFRPGEGRPNILDKIKNLEVQWIINTSSEAKSGKEESQIRRAAVMRGIPVITTLSGALAAVQGLTQYVKNDLVAETMNQYFD